MAVPKSSITDAELSILNVIWNEGPLTARQITERVYEEVHVSSIGTVQKLISGLRRSGWYVAIVLDLCISSLQQSRERTWREFS